MQWKALHDTLISRADVTALCRRFGYETLEELLSGAADQNTADDLVDRLVTAGPVGVEVALAVLAPALRRATGRLRAWTGEDVGELITSACWVRLQKGHLPARPTRSVVAQARDRVVCRLQSSWNRATGSVPILDQVVASTTDVASEALERVAEADLISWVMSTAEIDDQTARIVVHSRALGVPMDAVAAAEGLAYHTAYRRRERAEKKIRASVQSTSPAMTITDV